MPTVDPTKPNVPPLIAEDFNSIPEFNRPNREWLVRFGVLLLAALVYIPLAGSFGLWDCWETHYGEVARYMHERSDLLSPWWGYKDQIGSEPKTGEWFFSKPILVMYGEMIFMRLIGFGEWAIRLPWAILGTLGVFMTYMGISRVFGRHSGLLAAGVLMTSPLYFFLSRQAITDLPYDGTMTIGQMFFILAYFGPKYSASNRGFIGWALGSIGFFLLLAVPQFIIIGLDLSPDRDFGRYSASMRFWLTIQKTGWIHTIMYFLATLGLLALIGVPMWKEYKAGTLFTDERKDAWMRRFLLWTAFAFFGLSTLGKGLLGFMLPGALLGLYLLISGEWRALKRLEIGRGVLVMCLVMLPWYLGMFAKHGQAFYNRFLVHDHFNRIGAGVHALDSGTFEHMLKWLSIGMFPWFALVPLLFWGLARLRLKNASGPSRTKLFLYIWGFFAYLLFSLSATTFHHYIFPALPPTAMLIGIMLNEFLDDRTWVPRVLILAGIGILIGIGLTIRSDPQSFRNMFTYKYDREWPENPPIDPDATVGPNTDKTWAESTYYANTPTIIHKLLKAKPLQYKTFITVIMVLATIALILMIFTPKIRKVGTLGLWGSALLLAYWCLNWYMPMLTPSWSVKYVFEDYFSRCEIVPNPPEIEEAYEPLLSKIGLGFIPDAFGSKPKRVCREDIVAWLITWRGETYYTSSEIKPLMKQSQLAPYLETLNKGNTFYALTQANRINGLRTALNRETETLKKKGVPGLTDITSWKVEAVHQESAYFALAKATPIRGPVEEEEVDKPAPESEPEEEPVDIPPPGM